MPVNIRYGNPFRTKNSLEKAVMSGLTRRKRTQRNGRVYASDGTFCVRRNTLYTAMPMQSTISPASSLYMSIGTAVHRTIQDALFAEGTLLFSEYHLPEVGINLGGYVDAIAVVNGKIAGIEIKTTGRLPGDVKAYHVGQATLYEAILGMPVYLLYVSRSVADWRGTVLLESSPLMSTRAQRADALTTVALSSLFIQKRKLPSVPAHFTGPSDCGHCPFLNACWGGIKPVWPQADTKTHESLLRKARAQADKILDNTPRRRVGILKHIQRHGTHHAARILAGEWAPLLHSWE